jgi:hypothetical protein
MISGSERLRALPEGRCWRVAADSAGPWRRRFLLAGSWVGRDVAIRQKLHCFRERYCAVAILIALLEKRRLRQLGGGNLAVAVFVELPKSLLQNLFSIRLLGRP